MTIGDLLDIPGVTVQPTSDLPAGQTYMDAASGRCLRCDARYCIDGCYAYEVGYVYVTGQGWVDHARARSQERRWARAGLTYGVDHPVRRVEW